MHRKEIRLVAEGREITKFETADGGDKTKVTSAGHGLSDGDLILIDGTTNYEGTGLVVSESATDTFEIETDFVADDGAGMWMKTKDGQGTLSTGWFDAEPYDQAILYTDVSVWTDGDLTPTLEASPDKGVTALSTGMAGATLSSVTTELVQEVGPIGKLVRVTLDLGTTPEMTFKMYLELARTGAL